MRVLHLAGSASDPLLDEVSCLYARDCLEATAGRHETVCAHVSPEGSWRLPGSLSPADLAAAAPMGAGEALGRIAAAGVDVVLPQMFCRAGMTAYRSLWEVVGLPHVGNRGTVMAVGADKAWTRALLSEAGVDVAAGELVRPGERVTMAPPLVVKPVDSDNSVGVTLVRSAAELQAALRAAWAASPAALVERYIEAGREVRCGILELDGELTSLPLEEYRLDPAAPVRTVADKLGREPDGALRLMAKRADVAWMVDADDPITAPVQRVARACHAALGCRDHSLWDMRIDADGRPWVLEASLYCSFARQSVVVAMASAAGIGLETLFDRSLEQALARGPI